MTRYHSAVIFVDNIQKSKKFYCDILEQKVEDDFGRNIQLRCGLSLWELRDDHIIPASLERRRIRNSSNRFELYFESDNLDNVYARLSDNSIEFLHGIHEEIWGQRTIRFFDPDGHIVEIGEPLEVFVKRFAGKGLSDEKIAETSFIPLQKVKAILKR
ncbi:MAG: glyoxalase/bleomycin resistance/dioxygenase family protein [Chitinivibrionales bacterium]|nr:glyoxalase/bleomycin resistance/dioxygenase family protein [Chitinivibrionales bacterium]